MKRLGSLFLLVAVLLATMPCQAYTNKSYLSGRYDGVNLPRQTTAFDLLKLKNERSLNGALQATGFYQESADKDDLAQYFLIHDKTSIDIRASRTDTGFETTKGTDADFDFTYIAHTRLVDDTLAASINAAALAIDFKPEQSSYGVELGYHQGLDKLCKHLYFYATAPIIHVERDIHATISGTAGDPLEVTKKFFSGNLETLSVNDPVVEDGNGQVKLTHAKLGGEQSAHGVADIDLGLGYAFVDDKNCHFSAAFAITIPTGNEPTGEYLFEPIYGDAGHFGIGGDLNGWVRFHGDAHCGWMLKGAAKVRYLFSDTEIRTLGIKGREWGQYFLLGKVGQDQLIPAANVLTTDVRVTPGAQFDGLVGLNYVHHGFNADLGYNMYAREKESVHLKSFEDNTYAIAARGYDTHSGADPLPFVIAPNTVDGGKVAAATINATTIDTDTAATPLQFTHSVYGSLGYLFDSKSFPVLIAAGGKYELPSTNSAIEQWSAWVKIGCGF